MVRSRTSYRLACVLALSLAATAGCDDDSDDPTPDPGTADLRVVHASPDAPAVDIYAAGVSTPLVTNLAYGEVTDYLTVDEGSYDIEIRAAGADPSSTPVFNTGALALADGDVVTAIAAGFLDSTDSADDFRVIPLAEGFADGDAGTTNVRIVHASADAPTVAIDVGNDGTPEIDSLARFADTGAAGVALPSDAALQVGIWAGDPLARVTAFTTPALPEGADLFVIATGRLGTLPRADDGFGLLAVGPAGAIGMIRQNPTVFAMHGSPNAPAVDIYAGQSALVEAISFGELSGPIQVPPGAYDLDFYAAGTGPGTPVVTATTPQLAAGERYLAIASGFLGATGDGAFQLIPVADELDFADADNARVGVVHASPDAPAVDVGTLTGDVMTQPALVGDIAFPESTSGAGLQVPPASLTLGVAAAGSPNPVATFDVATTAGLRAYAVAAGALAPQDGEESFRLFLVVTSEFPWVIAEVNPN